ncbi:MAG TPA: glutamate decarboxylase [Actinobacteria bacterium]|nr:glutamate decarboxylase [Actinomycetota bacterium]
MFLSRKTKFEKVRDTERVHAGTYSLRYFRERVPKHEMREAGMPADAAYQLVHDELNMDGNPSLNVASFVTTWMEPEARKLIDENLHKNFIDHDEYPQTAQVQNRVVNMLVRLFNSPSEKTSIGTSTIGSSEAIMLGLLAHKWSWKKRRQAQGKSIDKPNLVMGADVHVVWEKFAKYFDVEARMIPMETDTFVLTVDKVAANIDENTICVGAIAGTTYTGQADPIKDINELLVNVKKDKGWDIPIHIDGASGGFIVPFVHPDLEWDFRLEQVRSINVSGHKYGLVYPGLGWLVFRDESDLPKDLIFDVNYLGGDMPTFTLNFSKGSSMVLAQYYNFLRLGRAGYRGIMTNILDNARYLAERLASTGQFELLNASQVLPIVTVRLKDTTKFTVFDLSEKLRETGWIVPAYTLPPNAQSVSVLRIVAKENFSRDMADLLYKDVVKGCDSLGKGKVVSLKQSRRAKQPEHLHKAC